MVLRLPIKGEIRQATISKTPTGKYFVSILCEAGETSKPKASIKENTSGKRTKNKLAKLHEKVANQRKDFLHKTSSKLISDNQTICTICIEDLNIKGMLANHKLALSISDCGWSMFVDMLKYKAEWYGKNILKIGRFEPSSKLCSCCGSINKELTLKDRDVNASINIKNFALKNHLSVERRLKNRNELPMLVGVMTSEAPSPLGKG